MRTTSEIIPDLRNVQSGSKGVFDKISKQIKFALSASASEYEGIIQSGNYRYFGDEHGIVAFEMHF